MFAFAAWDRREGSLLAMRDPFGIKPLYVLRHATGGVTVCSEIAPLLLCTEARQIDPIGLGQFLALGHTSNTHTLFSRIHKLDPGSLYVWQRDVSGMYNLRIERPDLIPASPMSLEEALEDSVAAHLTADVEVGAFLSSGVDSTLLCLLASKHVPGMRAYTLRLPESSQIDESELAGRNARAMGLRHVEVEVLRRDMALVAGDVIKIHGEPLGDAAVLPLSVLARRAAQDLKVVLSGEGGDELFGGYGRYRVSRHLGLGTRAMRPLSSHVAPYWAKIRSDRPRSRAIEALLWGGGFRSHIALLGGDLPLLAKIRPDVHRDVLAILAAEWQRVDDSGPDLSRAIAYDRLCWLPNMYLEKTDRSTMLWSLEARVPYLDAVVASVAATNSMELHAKEEPRQLLCSMFPDVQLPTRKLGLAVDVRALLELPALSEPLAFELHDPSSVLGRWIAEHHRKHVVERCGRSATLAFRLAMLGVWEQVSSVGVTV
jgi:asparagine synthase (glutamine-hydrolysing)